MFLLYRNEIQVHTQTCIQMFIETFVIYNYLQLLTVETTVTVIFKCVMLSERCWNQKVT